ncbi:MAG TPA: 2-C-methyl-D-erythritol 4-phosphate cytidylyltransferase [Nocardioidaceae bacterium]|nr:2-C-methyl-D-erythritol 4-phosphate cytidylyltransferase [Nocardioidaceae bacterium]
MPAAGRGVRLGPGDPKALRLLGGAPLLVHAVRALARSSGVEAVVVAAPANDVAAVQRLLGRQVLGTDVWVVPGGDTRQRSVAAALTALPAHIDTVLVHDAARPLVPVELVTRVVAALRDGAAAAIPVLPVPDTLKEIESVGASGRVVRTVDRTRLRAVQTPQGFRRDVLTQAHEAALVDGVETTDDAGLVELIGVEVVVVPGAEDAFKVTRPLDLVLAEAVLAGRPAARSSQL